jgi:CMP-N,N'-diacetyllegionaminic acid synthase
VTVLGVVTARAGSKGIPGKNIRPLAGRPLIQYTLDAARESAAFDRLMISTDDAEAAAIARDAGCEVPFMRPADLAKDDTPHLPVMQHALTWLRDHERYTPDWVMILLPTSPLRQARHIREAIDLGVSSGADSVVGVEQLPAHFNPMRVVKVDDRGFARLFIDDAPVKRRPGRRQDMPQGWVLTGGIYLFRTAVLFDANDPSLYGDTVAAYPMNWPHSFNVDDLEDWATAERLLSGLAVR